MFMEISEYKTKTYREFYKRMRNFHKAKESETDKWCLHATYNMCMEKEKNR